MKHPAYVLLFVLLLVASALTPVLQVQETTTILEAKPVVGSAAPSFSLTGMDGKTYELNGKRDKPLVINFWASWCGPCRMEAPDLRRLHQAYGQQIDFYAINVTSDDTLEEAKAFVDRYKLTFPVPLDLQGEVAKSYQLQAFPTTYLIDRNGVIRQKIIGMIEASSFEQELKKLLQPSP